MNTERIWIYTRMEEGYTLFPHGSDNLPSNVKNELSNLLKVEGLSSAYDGCATNLRFAPIEDYYMISVIFRNTSHPSHQRGFDCYVNFLYSPLETKIMFEGSFAKELDKCIKKSKEIAENYGLQQIEIDDFFTVSEKSVITPSKLKAYAIAVDRVAKKERSGAIYMGIPQNESMKKIALYLLDLLPLPLRSKIGIYVNAYSATETAKTDLVLLSETELDNICSSTTRGTMKNAVILNYDSFTWEIKRAGADELCYIIGTKNEEYKNICKLLYDCDSLETFFKLISLYCRMYKKEITIEECSVGIIELMHQMTVSSAILNGYKLPDETANIKKKKAYKKFPEVLKAIERLEQLERIKLAEQKAKEEELHAEQKFVYEKDTVGAAPVKKEAKKLILNPKHIPLICDIEVFVSLVLKIIGVLAVVFLKKSLLITLPIYICLLAVLQYVDYFAAQVRSSLPVESDKKEDKEEKSEDESSETPSSDQ